MQYLGNVSAMETVLFLFIFFRNVYSQNPNSGVDKIRSFHLISQDFSLWNVLELRSNSPRHIPILSLFLFLLLLLRRFRRGFNRGSGWWWSLGGWSHTYLSKAKCKTHNCMHFTVYGALDIFQ